MIQVLQTLNKSFLTITVVLILIGWGLTASSQEAKLNICLSPEHQANHLLLHVVVEDFTDILSYQFGLSWDNTQYQLLGYDNLHPELNHFTENNFGPVKKEAFEKTDMIRTSWNELSATPVTVDDGSVLFTMRFMKISNSIGYDFRVTGHKWFRNEVVNRKMELLQIQAKVEDCLNEDISSQELPNELVLDGQEEGLVLHMNITPNPTSNYAVIEFNKKISGKLEILGMDGKVITSESFTQLSNYSLDLLNYQPGPYLLKFISEGESVITKRLIRIK